jgi:hypothetical protein
MSSYSPFLIYLSPSCIAPFVCFTSSRFRESRDAASLARYLAWHRITQQIAANKARRVRARLHVHHLCKSEATDTFDTSRGNLFDEKKPPPSSRWCYHCVTALSRWAAV